MRVFLWIFLIFVAVVSSNPESHLQKVIENISILSRITNGLTIGSEWLNKTTSLKEGIGELLDFRYTDDLSRLNLSEALQYPAKIQTFQQKLPKVTSLQVLDKVDFVGGMKVLAELQADLPDLRQAFKNMTQSMNFEGALLLLKDNVAIVIENFKIFQDHTKDQEIMNYMNKIPDLEEHLKLKSVFHAAASFSRGSKQLQDLQKELDELKKHVKDWIPLIEEQQSISGMIVDLSAVENTVEVMTKPAGRKELTVGLPNGIDDLELMFNDVKGEWVKKVLAGGKEPKELEKILEPLKTFTSGMRRLEGLWTKVKDRKSIDMLRSLRNSLNASNLPLPKNPADIESSIDTVRGCLSNLIPYSTIPSTIESPIYHGHVVNYFKFMEWFKGQLRMFDEVIPAMKTMKEIQPSHHQETLDYLSRTFENLTDSMTAPVLKGFVDKMKVIPGYESFLSTMDLLAEKFTPFGSGIRRYRFGAITFVKKIPAILNGTNLLETLECIDNAKFVPLEVLGMMHFSEDAQRWNIDSAKLTSVEKYLGSVKDLSDELGKVISSADQKPKIRRRRQIARVDDWEKTARDLRKGVQVLVDMENVWKNQKKVEHVAKCGQAVDKVISGLPGMSDVWTDKNKKGLITLVGEVNALDGKCANISMTDLTALSQVFQHATLITGVPINAHLLDNPVSVSLATSQDPAIQKFSTDFKDLSDLNLDFAKATDLLNAAEATLQPITDFFNSIFGIKPPPKPMKPNLKPPPPTVSPGANSMNFAAGTTEVAASSTLIVLLIVIPLLLLGLGCGLFVIWWFLKRNDHLFWHRLLMNKEKYQQLLIRHSRYLSFQEEEFKGPNPKYKNLLEAVCAGSLESAEAFITQGAWINAERETQTCLHLAVIKGHVELVKLLIRHGADRSALNENYKTPEEQIAVEIEKHETVLKEESKKLEPGGDEEDRKAEEKEIADQQKAKSDAKLKLGKLEKVMEKFKELKDQEFLRCVPPLYPPRKFRILIAPDCESLKFAKKYVENLTEDFAAATHIVVKVDQDGVYDVYESYLSKIHMLFGRAMVVKESWLEACLKRAGNMQNDYRYQVEKVKVKDQVYSTMKEWHLSFHMKQIPYLRDTQLFFSGAQDWMFHAVVDRLGITLLKEIPQGLGMNQYNFEIAHPYYLFNSKVMWFLSPFSEPKPSEILEDWRVLTFEELLIVLLKREKVFNPEKIRYSAIHGADDPANYTVDQKKKAALRKKENGEVN